MSSHIKVGSSIQVEVDGLLTNGIVFDIDTRVIHNDDDDSNVKKNVVRFYSENFCGDNWSCYDDDATLKVTDIPAQTIANRFRSWFWECPHYYEPLGLKKPE